MSADAERPSAAKREKNPPRAPERKIGPFAGGVGCAIWINQIETDKGSRQLRSITINPRRYFDRETNQWKDAPSFNPADLPALIFSLQKAQEYCYETPLPNQGSGADPAQNAEGAGQDDEVHF